MNTSQRAPWRLPLFIRISVAIHLLALLMLVVDPALWRWALAMLIANHALISLIGLWPRSNWLGANLTKLPPAAAVKNEVALTIDDGPDPLVTPQVLDLLDNYGIKATFFCIGDKAAQYPALCRDIVRRGHTVENHSQHHRHHFSLLGLAGFRREIEAAQQTITGITGVAPLFFRAPAGLRNPFLAPVLAAMGLHLASWSIRGFDTRSGDAAKVKNRILGELHAGAILLMHDGNAALTKNGSAVILEVLPDLLQTAAARGLHFVTLRAVEVTF